MRKLLLSCLLAGAGITSVQAQTLFTYGPQSVSKDEFLKAYLKNTTSKVVDMSDSALRNYLDLYSLFKMKVAEAEKQSLDTVAKVQNDLNTYRKQLAKNYLTDEEVTKKMVKEAYDRMKENVRVSHILVTCSQGMDTVAPYRKIDSLYKLVMGGKISFDSLAKQNSDDKGSKDKGGDIGYITSLQTIYPFENMAYNTPVGKISKPFRTQFGYHIVKVTERRADRGQVQVAQILLATPKAKGPEAVATAKKLADSIVTALKGGTPFYEMVNKYSEDKFSVKDSGILKPFGAGRYVPEFENAAFAMKNPGEISILKTEYGYHVMKLIRKYPLASYDSMFKTLKHKVENDSRAANAKEIYFAKIKEKNGFKEYTKNLEDIKVAITRGVFDTGKMKGMFKATDYLNMTQPLFVLGGKTYSQIDFLTFFENLTRGRINGPKAAVVTDAYNLYLNNVVTDFQEHKLVEENPSFKEMMEQYRAGVLLFELMDRNVWSKASKDSAGLKNFYETTGKKYYWDPGFEGVVYTFKNKEAYDTGMIMLKAGKTEEDILKQMNSQTNPDRVSIQRGHYEFSRFKDATLEELKANNNMKMIVLPSGGFKQIVAKKLYPTASQKTLDEARGYVVAEYQEYLEKQYNQRMKAAYPFKVNDAVFKTMVKK